jgi:hypothetical protein
VRQLPLLFLVSLIGTVAVAWLSEIWIRNIPGPFAGNATFDSVLLGPTDELQLTWPEVVPGDWPAPKWRWHRVWATASVTALGTDPHWQPRGDGGASIVVTRRPTLNQRVQFVIDSGFPLRCLRSTHTFGLNGQDLWSWRSGILVDNSQWPSTPHLDSLPPLRLPVEVRWFGMLVNTAVFGVLIAAFVAATKSLAGRLRGRRGKCAACGYRLHAGSGCPECGLGRPA